MRISDWSSDVCSSDLSRSTFSYPPDRPPTRSRMPAKRSRTRLAPKIASPLQMPRYCTIRLPSTDEVVVTIMASPPMRVGRDKARSEEHTSELQSLMRISYAVFCLKKKNTIATKKQRQL